jgi:micrococcal nuclease
MGPLTYNVRYIGIDTPEVWPPPAEPFGDEATELNRDLVDNKRVTLVRDTQAADQDRYGRLLRFVVLEDRFINAEIVAAGLGRYYVSPNDCGSVFYQSEQQAKADKLGLWADR